MPDILKHQKHRTMKHLYYLFLFFVAIVALSGCDRYADIKREAERMNKVCPITYDFGSVTNVTFKDGMLIYKMLVNEDFGMTANALNKHPEVFKIALAFGDKDGLKLLADRDVTVCYVYRGDNSQETHTYYISPDDIRGILKREVSKNDLTRELINVQIDMANESMPQEIEQGMKLEKVELDGNNIIYTTVMDENIYDMDVFKNSDVKDELKKSILSEWALSKSDRRFLRQMVDCGFTLVYRFKGDTSDTATNVIITGKDMRNTLARSN